MVWSPNLTFNFKFWPSSYFNRGNFCILFEFLEADCQSHHFAQLLASFSFSKLTSLCRLQISDDEDDTHPNIDTPSLFKWRHEARLQRMEEFEKEKKAIKEEKERSC